MDHEHRSDRFTTVEDRYAGYTVYDQSNEKIGKVDDLFLDEDDQPEYIGVKMGFLGTRSTLIPFQMPTVDNGRQAIVVSTDKETAKNGPAFDAGREITPEIGEDEVMVPVTEEEVVVSKRPVAKEEVRIRKNVVEDTEVVEEDVRREEIDVEDETGGVTSRAFLQSYNKGRSRKDRFKDRFSQEDWGGYSMIGKGVPE